MKRTYSAIGYLPVVMVAPWRTARVHPLPMREPKDQLTVRLARKTDLADVEDMVNDFVKGHPTKHHPRSRSALRDAYFGEAPVANLVVATLERRTIGMGQWTLIYDMFWGMYGANAEWLYMRPEYRGRGFVAAIVAQICAQVRSAGGEFLHGGGDDEVERLYERSAIGRGTNECHLSAKAFQVFADLAGLAPLTETWDYCDMAHAELARDNSRIEYLTYCRETGPLRSEIRRVEVTFR